MFPGMRITPRWLEDLPYSLSNVHVHMYTYASICKLQKIIYITWTTGRIVIKSTYVASYLWVAFGCFTKRKRIVRPHTSCEKKTWRSIITVSNIFLLSPRTLGKFPILTIIFFQMGWLKPPSSFGFNSQRVSTSMARLLERFGGRNQTVAPKPAKTHSFSSCIRWNWGFLVHATPPKKSDRNFAKETYYMCGHDDPECLNDSKTSLELLLRIFIWIFVVFCIFLGPRKQSVESHHEALPQNPWQQDQSPTFPLLTP